MTSEESALLAAAKASPLDATPRLALADWLDEHDRPLDAALQRVLAEPDRDDHRLAYADVVEATDPARAEFIRVQLELARTPEVKKPRKPTASRYGSRSREDWARYKERAKPWHRREHLLKRQSELMSLPNPRDAIAVRDWACSPANDWGHILQATPIWSGVDPEYYHRCVWERGFIGSLIVPGKDWVGLADKLTEQHPITHVMLTTVPATVYVDVDGYVGLQFLGRNRRHDCRGRPEYAIPWMLKDEFPRITFTLPRESLSLEVLRSMTHSIRVPEEMFRDISPGATRALESITLDIGRHLEEGNP